MSLWMAKDYIKKALNRWNDDGKYWAKEALKEIEEAEAENKWLKEGLIEIRKSTEIMEARRLAEQTLSRKRNEVEEATIETASSGGESSVTKYV